MSRLTKKEYYVLSIITPLLVLIAPTLALIITEHAFDYWFIPILVYGMTLFVGIPVYLKHKREWKKEAFGKC